MGLHQSLSSCAAAAPLFGEGVVPNSHPGPLLTQLKAINYLLSYCSFGEDASPDLAPASIQAAVGSDVVLPAPMLPPPQTLHGGLCMAAASSSSVSVLREPQVAPCLPRWGSRICSSSMAVVVAVGSPELPRFAGLCNEPGGQKACARASKRLYVGADLGLLGNWDYVLLGNED